MTVLMLSTDQNIFRDGSEVQNRMIEYGSLVDELHIIVRTQNLEFRTQNFGNVFIYPTNTRCKSFYFWDAYKIAKNILIQFSVLGSRFLVTAQDPFETGLVGYLLKRKFKIPLQIQIHTDFLSPYFWRESLKNKIRVLLGKWLVKKADCIRVVSERIKKSLESNVKCQMSNVSVLPIFVDVEKIKNAPAKTDLRKKYPDYDFIILMASRLTKEKNIGMAIKAFADAKKANPTRMTRTLLLIVGDGPEKNNLELRTNNLELKNNVKFEHWTDDLISYYKTADLFLNTSNYEGYGRTIIEALAASCPVLTTDVGVASEIIEFGKSGIIINPRDIRALTESILEIIRSRQNYRGRIGDGVIKNKNEYLSQYKKTFSCCGFMGIE